MVIVDTTVWIDYLRGTSTAQVTWLEEAMERQRLGLVDLILCEVLQGVRTHTHLKEVRQALSRFAIFTTGGTALAIAAASNYVALRHQGYTVLDILPTAKAGGFLGSRSLRFMFLVHGSVAVFRTMFRAVPCGSPGRGLTTPRPSSELGSWMVVHAFNILPARLPRRTPYVELRKNSLCGDGHHLLRIRPV